MSWSSSTNSSLVRQRNAARRSTSSSSHVVASSKRPSKSKTPLRRHSRSYASSTATICAGVLGIRRFARRAPSRYVSPWRRRDFAHESSDSSRAIAGAGNVSERSDTASVKSRCRSAAMTGTGRPAPHGRRARARGRRGGTCPRGPPRHPRARSRVRSSPAALRVKVVTRTWRGSSDSSCTRRTTRSVSTRVLPAPAPARTTILRSGASMASSCSGVKPSGPCPSSSATTATYRRAPTPVVADGARPHRHVAGTRETRW